MMVQIGKDKDKKQPASGQNMKDVKKPSTLNHKLVASAPKGDTCFQCGKAGHWKRNYPIHLEECSKRKGNEIFASGIIILLFVLYPH